MGVADTAAASTAAASAPSEVSCSLGATAEDWLSKQPLCAPGGALRLLVHLPRLQSGVLLAG